MSDTVHCVMPFDAHDVMFIDVIEYIWILEYSIHCV